MAGFATAMLLATWMRIAQATFSSLTMPWTACWLVILGAIGGGALLRRPVPRAVLPLGVAVSPWLFSLVGMLYDKTGGTVSLGVFGAAILAAVLTAIAAGAPAAALGATLAGLGRLPFTLLGASAGAMLSGFYLFERLGHTGTVLLCAVLLAGVVLARRATSPTGDQFPVQVAAAGFLAAASTVVLLRLLGPLFGNPTATAALVVSLILIGMAIGACFASTSPARVATAAALFALLLAIPYAMGERLALVAMFLRTLGSIGVEGQALGWFLTVGPFLLPCGIALGVLAAWPSDADRKALPGAALGVALGILAGGLVLIPGLGAEAAWRVLVVAALLVAVSRVHRLPVAGRVALSGAALIAVALLTAAGPGPLWRTGRLAEATFEGIDSVRGNLDDFQRSTARAQTGRQEGADAFVAVQASQDTVVIVDGRGAQSARLDLESVGMAGLLGAVLQPKATSALLLDLGTGTAMNWLIDAPGMERVDVVVRDPAELRGAEAAAMANRQVLSNPRVRVVRADPAEAVRVSGPTYGVILSLTGGLGRYTRTFFQGCARRLTPEGVLVLGLPLAEVNRQTFDTLLATLAPDFPHVALWRTGGKFALLTASRVPTDDEAIFARMGVSPLGPALVAIWRVNSLDGLYARRLTVKPRAAVTASADRNVLEFLSWRSATWLFRASLLGELVAEGADAGATDARREQVEALDALQGSASTAPAQDAPDARKLRYAARGFYRKGDYRRAVAAWSKQENGVGSPADMRILAESLANLGDERAIEFIRRLPRGDRVALLARLRFQQRKGNDTRDALAATFTIWRGSAAGDPQLLGRSLELAVTLAQQNNSKTRSVGAAQLYHMIRRPFALAVANDKRLDTALTLALMADTAKDPRLTREALAAYGTFYPWTLKVLQARVLVLKAAGDPGADQARADLLAFRKARNLDLGPEATP